jgi:hypothetical protein
MKPRSAGHLHVEAVEKPLFESQRPLRMARMNPHHLSFLDSKFLIAVPPAPTFKACGL